MSDPYLKTHACVARLLSEHAKHPRLIIAVDVDSTIYPYHGTSDTHAQVVSLVRRAQGAGFYIVLFTAAHPERYDSMREYCVGRGIRVDSINANPIDLPFGNHGKIYFNLLLDDRAGLGQACETLELVLDAIGADRA